MTAQDVYDLLLTQQDVRDYLRGVEEGSETDRAAQRAMLSAIGFMRGSGIHDIMALEDPEQYATACLLRCRLLVDGATGAEAEDIRRQYNEIVLQLRYDEKNTENEVI